MSLFAERDIRSRSRNYAFAGLSLEKPHVDRTDRFSRQHDIRDADSLGIISSWQYGYGAQQLLRAPHFETAFWNEIYN